MITRFLREGTRFVFSLFFAFTPKSHSGPATMLIPAQLGCSSATCFLLDDFSEPNVFKSRTIHIKVARLNYDNKTEESFRRELPPVDATVVCCPKGSNDFSDC